LYNNVNSIYFEHVYIETLETPTLDELPLIYEYISKSVYKAHHHIPNIDYIAKADSYFN